MAVPYANRHMDNEGRVWATCPTCWTVIELQERKDFESMTGKEYVEHVTREHPETVT